MKKVYLLVNLKSGSNKGEGALKELESILQEKKIPYNGIPILPIADIHNHHLDITIVEKPNLIKFFYLFSKTLN